MKKLIAVILLAVSARLGAFLFLDPKRRRYMMLIIRQAPYIPFRYLT